MVRFNVVVSAWFGIVETAGIRHVMRFVILESAKDRVIGVDTSGQ
jgi:multisubunit Na+/H+ antiporter MnhF subunit